MGVSIFFIIAFIAGQLPSLVSFGGRWSLLDVFVCVSFLLFAIRVIRKRAEFNRFRLLRALLLYFIVSLFTIIIRAFARHTVLTNDLLYLLRWVLYGGIYLYVVSEEKRRLQTWLYALYIAGVVMAFVGLVQLILYPDLRNLMYIGWDPHYRRVFGTLLDPNFAGIIYVLTFLAGLSLSLAKKYIRPVVVGQVLTLAALFLTYSRSSFLACIVGAALWFLFRKSYTTLIIFVTSFLAIVLLLPGGAEGQNIFRSVSSSARLGSYVVGWQYFLRSPLMGSGFVSTPTSTLPNILVSRAGAIDSSLLFVLASTGLLGFASYIYLLHKVETVGRLARGLRKNDPFLLSSFAAILCHSLFINSLFYPWVMAWMWILIAVTERTTTGMLRSS